jgi:hypothetical protein
MPTTPQIRPTPTTADRVRPGQWLYRSGEYARIREAGPALHPKFGRIIRISLESGAVIHYAPYATVDVCEFVGTDKQ